MKNRHHFVPRLLLREFATGPKQIHLINVRRWLKVENASLRDQAYRRKFYGRDDTLEDALADLEGAAAPLLVGIRRAGRPPARGSLEHRMLALFVAAQASRTEGAIQRATRPADLLAEVAFDGALPEGWALSKDERVRLVMGNVGAIAEWMLDLRMTLVSASTGSRFVLSDNPVVKHNTFREDITYRGVLGFGSVGIQVFLPIAPSATLLLSDGAVYKVGQKGRSDAVSATSDDVGALNLLQCLRANENIYYGAPGDVTEIERKKRRVDALRKLPKVTVNVATGESGNDELLHTYERMEDVKLRLSFVGIRRSARREFPEGGFGDLRRTLSRRLHSQEPPMDGPRDRKFTIARRINE